MDSVFVQGFPSQWSLGLEACKSYSGAQESLSVWVFDGNFCYKFPFGTKYGPSMQDNTLSLSQYSCPSNMTLEMNNQKNMKMMCSEVVSLFSVTVNVYYNQPIKMTNGTSTWLRSTYRQWLLVINKELSWLVGELWEDSTAVNCATYSIVLACWKAYNLQCIFRVLPVLCDWVEIEIVEAISKQWVSFCSGRPV
jgi:hypothetical protein